MGLSICTPDLCDEYPNVEVLEPIFKNYGGKSEFFGEIVTVKCFEDNSFVKEQVGTPGKGRVLVVDGGGSNRNALLGDMLAEKAAENGWAGIVIFGHIRDVDIIGKTDLGVQALGTHPRKTEKRGLGDLNVVVKFAGCHIQPGQWLYADNNGIIISNDELQLTEN